MPRIGLIFDVRRRDCDSSFSLFWGFVDGAILEKLGISLFGLSFCYSSCESCLSTQSMLSQILPEMLKAQTFP